MRLGIIARLSTVLITRSCPLVAFILLATWINPVEFSKYAFYFSAWQITHQLMAIQMPFMMFRFAHDPTLQKHLKTISSHLAFGAIVLIPITFAAWSTGNIYAYILTTSLIAAVHTCLFEYSRARLHETIAFAAYALPALALITSSLIFKALELELTFSDIYIIESITLIFSSLLLATTLKTLRNINLKKFATALKTLIPPWKKYGIPLIPNTMIWYGIFNTPPIILFWQNVAPEELSSQAVLLRILVLLATLSATIAMVIQKPLLMLYTKNQPQYHKLKAKWLKKLLLALILGGAFLSYGLSYLAGYLKPLLPDMYSATIYCAHLLSFSLAIFFCNHLVSQFLIIELKTLKASQTLSIGGAVFFIVLAGGVMLNANIGIFAIYAMLTSILTTLLLRLKYL